MEKQRKTGKMFVYGSLRKGYHNHYLINGKAKYLGLAVIYGYKLVSLGSYPAIYPSGNDKDKVVGEIYFEIEQKTVEQIDEMESQAGYDCVTETAFCEDGKQYQVDVYIFPEKPSFRHIPVESGDWASFML